MYDYAQLCSFVDPKLDPQEPDKIDGFVLNTGLLWGDLKQGGFLAEILELAKYLRMELSAPAMGLVHCADRSEAAELLVRTWPHLDSLLSSGVRMVPRYLVDELRKEQHVEPAVVSSIMTADGWLALMSVAKYRLFSAAKYRLFSADDVRKIMNSGEFEAIMAEYMESWGRRACPSPLNTRRPPLFPFRCESHQTIRYHLTKSPFPPLPPLACWFWIGMPHQKFVE